MSHRPMRHAPQCTTADSWCRCASTNTLVPASRTSRVRSTRSDVHRPKLCRQIRPGTTRLDDSPTNRDVDTANTRTSRCACSACLSSTGRPVLCGADFRKSARSVEHRSADDGDSKKKEIDSCLQNYVFCFERTRTTPFRDEATVAPSH